MYSALAGPQSLAWYEASHRQHDIEGIVGSLLAGARHGDITPNAAAVVANAQGLPGIIAAGAWRSSQAAWWLYRPEGGQQWMKLDEAATRQPPAELTVIGGDMSLAPHGPSTVPAEWRPPADLIDAALLAQSRANGDTGPGTAWKFVEKLPHEGKPGYVVMQAERDADGAILGAYVEYEGWHFNGLQGAALAAGDAGWPWSLHPRSFAARWIAPGRLQALEASFARDFASFLEQSAAYTKAGGNPGDGDVAPLFCKILPLRGHVNGRPAWLYGDDQRLGGESLFVGVYTYESELLWRTLLPALVCLVALLVSTVLLWIGHRLWFPPLGRELGRIAQAARVVHALRGPFYWPRTRIRELRDLQRAVEEAAAAWDTHDKAAHGTGGPASPVRALTEEPAAPQALPTDLPRIRLKAEDAATDPMPTPAPPAIVLPAAGAAIDVRAVPVTQENPLLAPPAAFIQAMDSLRKQLTDTKKALDELHRQRVLPGEEKAREVALAERLLGALRGANAETGFEAVLATALGTAESRVYTVQNEFALLRDAQAGASALLPIELARPGHPLFFLGLERARALWIDDAAADPRVARIFSGRKLAEPLSLAALLLPDNAQVWVALRPQGAQGWRAAEQVFAEALVRAQAVAGETAASVIELPGPPEISPQSAHALWAQPNLPPHPDLPMYREMVDSAAAGLFTLSRTGRFLYVNGPAERCFGSPAGLLLGKALADIATRGERGAVESALQMALDGAAMEERDIHFIPAQGTPVLLRVFLTPLQDEGGEPTGISGCVVDVGELRARELKLARQEAVYRNVVEGAPQLLWSIDAIGCISFVNGVSRELYGYEPEELSGRPISVLCDEEQARKDVERLALLLGGKACTGYHTVHRHKDGSPVPLVVAASRQVDASGRVTQAVGMAMVAREDGEDA